MNRRELTSVTASVAGALLLPALVIVGSPGAAGATPVAPTTTPSAAPVEDPEGDLGTWSVTATGPDTWVVGWQSPDRLPMTSDRPTIVSADGTAGVPEGVAVGVPTVAEDGRTVEVSVTSTTPPSPESLDVVLSGAVLDEGTRMASPAPTPTQRWQQPVQKLLDVDPGRSGDLPIVTSDYERQGIAIRGLRRDVEMVGHVVKPAPAAEDSSHPLVVFLHGRHTSCYKPQTDVTTWRWPCPAPQVPVPSHLGYDYLQRLLASQGYVTVSIAANGINAQDDRTPDNGTDARSQLVQAHLDKWAEWSGYKHKFDLDRVVLVGHSRGGEGVARASLEIPLDAPYTVAGQVLIGPTNFGRQTTPYVPAVTILPSCDGDVIDLVGQTYTDVARGLADGDTAMKSSVMAVGANHNYFNTEWTPGLAASLAGDDWGGKGGVCGPGTETRLTAAEQRRVGKAYVAGAVHLFGNGDQDYRPMFDGSAVRVGSTRDAVVLSHMVGGGRTMRVPGTDATLSSAVGATTALCEGTTPAGQTGKLLCGRHALSLLSTPHWPAAGSLLPTDEAFEMSWRAAGGRGGLTLADSLDFSGSDWLDLRTVVDPKVGDVQLKVRLTDQDGASVLARPVAGGVLPALPTGDRWIPGKYWAQTLRVPVSRMTGIDTSAVSRVELVGTSDEGRVWVLDLAAASATLPGVPDERVPVVDVGEVTVDEGGDGTREAELPFTVTGEVDQPAEFWLYAFGGDGIDPVRVDVDLPIGSSSGTISWQYAGDELDSYPEVFHEIIGHAISNVMLRDNQGRVVVVDDDPTPELSFGAVQSSVPEGGVAELRLTMSEPSGVDVGVGMVIQPADGTSLRAHDVKERWLRRWTSWKAGTDPALHQLEIHQFIWLSPGETSALFRIPILDDSRTEGRESMTVRATTEDGWSSDPVTVHVPAGD